jgi:hypothetical protein
MSLPKVEQALELTDEQVGEVGDDGDMLPAGAGHGVDLAVKVFAAVGGLPFNGEIGFRRQQGLRLRQNGRHGDVLFGYTSRGHELRFFEELEPQG